MSTDDQGHGAEDETAASFFRVIEETRANLAEYRSQGRGFGNRYCKLRPSWLFRLLGAGKEFAELYGHQKVLYEMGTVVWGHTIQANSELFERRRGDRPAAFLYSTDPAMEHCPLVLSRAAGGLFDIKGASTDPDLAEFSRKLADEYEHDWKLSVPVRLTSGLQCHYATGMVFRRHLPDGYLAEGLFPMLICPERTPVSFILPSRWWAQEFIEEVWR